MKSTNTRTRRAAKQPTATVVAAYDAVVDSKKRISLRGSTVKHFHVQELSDGRFVLEPRVLVPPEAVSARTLKMLGESASSLRNGRASAPIDLPDLIED